MNQHKEMEEAREMPRDMEEEKTVDTMGERVHRLRKERGLTMAELGVYSRTSESTISLLESGKRNASARTVESIADALGVQPGELYPKGIAPSRHNRDSEGHTSPRLEDVKGGFLRAVLEDLRDGNIDVEHAEQTILRLVKI
jgi:transcriptional regulator with XRE-family HTH domain